jgi:hypothetical protein
VKLQVKSVEKAEVILNKLSNKSAQILFITQTILFFINAVLRSAPFWNFKQRRMAVSY